MKNVSDAACATLAAWHAARPTAALMGEFSAGKSTLLNVLLGRDILPTRATATAMPAVWTTHGATRRATGLSYDGVQIDLDPDSLDHGGGDGLLAIRLEDPAEILQHLDILDTPGISDARLQMGLIPFLASHVDFAVWCSPVTQLWRQSERAMWRSLPATLRSRSILAVTGIDRVLPGDLVRAMDRARKETSRLFGSHLPVASPVAVAAREAGLEEQWFESGAAAIVDAIVDTAGSVDRIFTLLDETSSVSATKSIFAAPAPTTTDENLSAKTKAGKVGSCGEVFEELSRIHEIPSNDQLSAMIDHIRDTVNAHVGDDDDERHLAERILQTVGGGDPDPGRVVRQMIGECADFADGPWRRLG